ncbi:hypothetical protein LK996_13475 [Lysobacter sp. A6]|uniref:SH3 domain-containing protein n=1 Tax=Noviluteimonas lactosilytica TaxID=2888523 RepID=A0ABS8JKF5_9GAMM|nr:hypothetical protein [Lysobacter lactosilyticus]MCC8364083.1 hypothetical protein [Lysobacter lactosilyticus]
MTRLAWIAVLASVVTLGCARERERVFIEGELALLEEPYPMGYPSSRPMPNRLIRKLHDEEVEVLDTFTDKEFLVSEVRTREGVEGYVVCCSTGVPFEQFPTTGNDKDR